MDTEQSYSLGDAAIAAGVDWTRLKNWLDRKQIKLDGAEPEPGRHRRFSFLDVLRIALIGQMVRWGLTADTSSNLVEGLLKQHFRKELREFLSDPESQASTIQMLFVNTVCAVWYDESTAIYRTRIWTSGGAGERNPVQAQSGASVLLIDVEKIVKTAFDRLKE